MAAGSISPYLLNNFGNVAESELRYRYSYTFVGNDQIGDSTTNFGLGAAFDRAHLHRRQAGRHRRIGR